MSEDIKNIKEDLERLEKRITWIERLLMTEGRELWSDTATHISNWDRDKDV